MMNLRSHIPGRFRAGGSRAGNLAVVLALVAGVVVSQFGVAGAQAVSDTFELDGNPQASPALAIPPVNLAPEDWENILTSAADNTAVDLGNNITRIARTAVPIPDPEA